MTERILDDPFCGEMYDRQMVELLSRVLKTHVSGASTCGPGTTA